MFMNFAIGKILPAAAAYYHYCND